MFIEEPIEDFQRSLKKLLQTEKKCQKKNTYDYFNIDKNDKEIVILDLSKYDSVFKDGTGEVKLNNKFFFRPTWEQLIPIPVTRNLYEKLCSKYGKRKIDKLKFRPNGVATVRLLKDKSLYPLNDMELFFSLGRQSFFILLNDIQQSKQEI